MTKSSDQQKITEFQSSADLGDRNYESPPFTLLIQEFTDVKYLMVSWLTKAALNFLCHSVCLILKNIIFNIALFS